MKQKFIHTYCFKVVLILLFTLFYSCNPDRTAKIRVQNNVHNTILTSINFGDYAVYGDLIPGATSNQMTITDDKDNWPKSNQIEFYMQANNKLVYLKTKNSYTLYPDDDLTVTIWDTTEVVNPLINNQLP